MLIKYNAEIQAYAIQENLHRLVNQIYKLLPDREEGVDWQKPLETILEELGGMDRLLFGQHIQLFRVMSKLEGLFLLQDESDFILFRRTIFESLNILGEIMKKCQD